MPWRPLTHTLPGPLSRLSFGPVKGHYLILAGAIGLLILQRTSFFYGHFGYDDLYYAELATRLLHGQVDFGDHYVYRIVPILATALSYALFGVNDAASSLPAGLATLGILLLLLAYYRSRPAWQYGLAVAMYFGMRWNFFYADKLMPDVFVALFAFAGWLAYVRREHLGEWSGPALMAVSLFLAFNSKGTIILLLPLLLVYFAVDVARGRWAWWLRVAATGVPLLLVYFGAVTVLTGSPFSRFTAIVANQYLNPCSYDQLPWEHLVERLTTGYWSLLRDARLLPHLWVAVGGMLWFTVSRTKGDRTLRFFPATALLCFGAMNFMTISLTSYNPICLDARHILLFSPILAVCSVDTLVTILRQSGVPTDRWWFTLAVAVAALIFLKPAHDLAVYARSLNYVDVRAALRTTLATLPRPATVYGSRVTINYGRYYTGFTDTGLRFVPLDSLPACRERPSTDPPDFLLRTWYTDWHARASADAQTAEAVERGYVLRAAEQSTPVVQAEQLTCP